MKKEIQNCDLRRRGSTDTNASKERKKEPPIKQITTIIGFKEYVKEVPNDEKSGRMDPRLPEIARIPRIKKVNWFMFRPWKYDFKRHGIHRFLRAER